MSSSTSGSRPNRVRKRSTRTRAVSTSASSPTSPPGRSRRSAVPITESQKLFWKRVNTAGGIGGYEVDVTKYIKDNKYDPQTTARCTRRSSRTSWRSRRPSARRTTAAILPDLKSSNVVAAPASWTSAWAFEDDILESGTNYCFESMNSVDYAVETFKPKSVAAVHFPGDYGDDACGRRQGRGRGEQPDVHRHPDHARPGEPGLRRSPSWSRPSRTWSSSPPAPTEAAAIVGGAAQAGFKGKFIGTSPTWNPALLKSPAAPALTGAVPAVGAVGAVRHGHPGSHGDAGGGRRARSRPAPSDG